MAQIRVRDKYGNLLPQTDVRLSIGHTDTDAAYDDKRTDNVGACAFPVVMPSSDGYTLSVNTRNTKPEYGEFSKWYPNLDSDIDINLSRNPLERVSGASQYYFNKFIKGESAFLDYYRFLRGEDITPLLKQSMNLGSNCRRIFLMTKYTGVGGGIGVCNPDDFGNAFFDKFIEFLDLNQDFGIYTYACLFPDNKVIGNWSDLNKQKDFRGKIGEIAKQRNSFFAEELTNESDAHPELNGIDKSQFSATPGVLYCSGSLGPTGGDPMPEPQGDFCDFHNPRQYPNSVVDACVANHPSRLRGKRLFLGEPIGFGSKAINGNREDNPRIAKEMAGTGRGTAAGLIFHSTHGGYSQLYDDTEKACAEAWFGELR